MAYQQQYDNYQQPRQQQHPNRGAPSTGRQPAGYDDNYGYDQGQYDYEQWNNGYDQQGGGWGNGQAQQQQQHGYPNPNGQMRQAAQNRRPPPPQDQLGQEVYDERMYQQPQGRDPRSRPMGPPGGGAMRGGMQRGDSRGSGDGRPPNVQQSQQGPRAPKSERAMISPLSPQNFSQNSPFPSFPSQKGQPRPNLGSVDEAMALMSIGHTDEPQGRMGSGQGRGRGPAGPPQNRGPPPGRGGYGYTDMNRHDSGHSDGSAPSQQRPPPRGYPQQRPPPMNLEGVQRPPQRQLNPTSPTQRAFGPNTQRSMTMPQNMMPGANGRGSDSQQQHQWVGPGPVAGYHGPESPDYVPPRPATASGTKNDGRQQQFEQRPPMPQGPPSQQQQYQQYPQYEDRPPMPQVPLNQPQGSWQHQQYQDDGRGDLDNLYDDYYGDDARRGSKATSIDMPNFDAIPETGTKHRRGFSIENHLSPTALASNMQGSDATAGPTPVLNTNYHQDQIYQQASRSRSQPDLHEQYSQPVYEMAGDAPAVPPLPPATQMRPEERGFVDPTRPAPNGLPNGLRGRGPPPRGMTMDAVSNRGPPGQPYGANKQSNLDPRSRPQHPPVHRGYSGESAYSEPGPNAMRMGSPMAPANVIPRPGTAAPAPSRMPSDPVQRRAGIKPPIRNIDGTSANTIAGTTQPTNPDALPAHPTPVRAGLMQQKQDQPSLQTGRPPPMRQYNTDPTPAGHKGRPSTDGPPPRRASVPHPVTHDELNRLRNTLKTNPSDSATGLQLAKKLVEAASVLADEGGTADTRTRNKNREKFILEAHKIIKKLVSAGSAEAMFYLADSYGQGRLGLAVDTKEAFTLYQSAAKAGHAASAYRTAVCCEMGHEEGGGTKKDPLKAVQWYRRAAALGDSAAMYKMGMILLKGLLGQQKNLGEAINMLKRAADRADEENPHALHELALIYEAQTGNERIIRDEAYAAQLFMQAADLGYKFSQFRLGQAYEYGMLGYPIDARASIAWYTRAAAKEEHQSELALSGWYLTGSQGILEQSDTEAYLWARKAACAEPALPKALFAMGYFTEVGIGCPRSLEEAKRWYGRAAAYKFPKAQERLEELKKGGAKAQRGRERLSRTNQKQHEENCVVM